MTYDHTQVCTVIQDCPVDCTIPDVPVAPVNSVPEIAPMDDIQTAGEPSGQGQTIVYEEALPVGTASQASDKEFANGDY